MSDAGKSPPDAGPQAFPALFSPGSIGRLDLKNRVLMAPMEKNLCSANGVVTDRYIDYLVERARGDVALLRLEATYVDPLGKGRPFQAGAHSDAVIPGLTRLAYAVHGAGGLLSLELAHCGRQTNSLVTGRQPVAPSAVPCAASGGFMPRALKVGEIEDIVERFARAARRAIEAGLDAVEIHGASGYLLNAFMSPYTNLRTDEYGGSQANRMRFPLEVVRAVVAAVGTDTPLLYRLSADDFYPGGVTVQDTAPLALALEQAGVDLIDVSAGTYESILATQPPMEAPAGSLVALAAQIKQRVSIPVATAGKLGDLEVAEEAVSSGAVDFVTIGRGLHADPELLIKARSGRLDEIRACIACAECVGYLSRDQPAFCAVNPMTLREAALRPLRASIRKRVLVVGGGPAGLEAARTASMCGHSVRVFEQAAQLGGQARYGALADGRAAFAAPVRFLERELRRLGVAVTRELHADAEMIAHIAADVTIIAVGATPTLPAIPGDDLVHVTNSTEYLAVEASARETTAPLGDGPISRAEQVVVVGGSWTGCHVAALLLGRGLRVVIVETRGALAYDMGEQPGAVLRKRVLEHPGVEGVHLGATVERITPYHVVVWESRAGSSRHVTADAVVLVAGRQANHELVARVGEITGTTRAIVTVGDCASPRKLQDALRDGALAGTAL
jgi:2,4-dienoyl-CoA reductase-like NADH-dependent reductase (Old Yellow Enzyme family)/thioredoxin reductase